MDDEALCSADVIIRTTKANDITLLVCGLIGAPLMAYGVLDGIGGLQPEELDSVRGGSLHLAVQVLFGWPVLMAGFALVGAYAAFLGIGGAWRLLDRRPAIKADESGLVFHPSIHASPAPWPRVRGVKVGWDGSPTVEIALDRRFWSVLAWATSRRVSLYTIGVGMGLEEAEAAARRLNALRRAAEPSP